MRSFGFSIILIFCFGQALAQYTLIPDNEFELRLIAQGIDTEGIIDGQVLTDDIDHITELYVDTPFPPTFISDLTGIEDFISLEVLSFANNLVSSIDLSNNVNLISLNGKFNNLSSLDLTNNVLLETLDITNCFPGTCDQEHVISNLDLSNNVNLRTIFLNNYNFLSSLDLSNNPDMVSVGVSRNTILGSLNLKNGNNLNLSIVQILENPQLDCITVDDPVAATAGVDPPYDSWDVEPGVIFSKDCTLGMDDHYLSTRTLLYPNPAKDRIAVEVPFGAKTMGVAVFDMSGREMTTTMLSKGVLNIANLASGTYILKINTSLGSITKHLIKE